MTGLPLLTASVTTDRSAANRRTCTATLASPNLTVIPQDESSPLAPFGAELQLYAGWIDPASQSPYLIPATGLPELIPLGVFPILDTDPDDSGQDINMTLTGSDRSWAISQRGFLSIYTVVAGTAPETAIQAILQNQYPGLPALNMSPTGFQLPVMNFDAGADPWAACLTIATAAGCELYFDANGYPVGKPTPDPTQTVITWAYRVDGTGNAAPSLVSRAMTRRGISNNFIISATGSQNTTVGSGAATPVSASAQDNNPASATFVGGPFGNVPTFISSSLISSVDQCQAAANNALTLSLGSADVLTVTAAPAPMFAVDDVITVEDTRLNVDFNIVVDSVAYSVKHDTKTVITGRRVY